MKSQPHMKTIDFLSPVEQRTCWLKIAIGKKKRKKPTVFFFCIKINSPSNNMPSNTG